VLGDLVAIGPDPLQTLEILANLPNVRFVRGNTDRYVVSGDRPAPHAHDVDRDPALLPLFLAVESSFAWTRDQLGERDLTWLAALPVIQRLVLPDGTRLAGVHASPRSDDGTGITPDLPDQPRRNEILSWLSDHPAVTRYAVLDEEDDELDGLPLFQPSSLTGLTDEIAHGLMDYLNGKTDQDMRASRMVRWLQNLHAILKGHPG